MKIESIYINISVKDDKGASTRYENPSTKNFADAVNFLHEMREVLEPVEAKQDDTTASE